MRATSPLRARATRVVVGIAALTCAGAVLAGCGSASTGAFNRKAYCDAMHDEVGQIPREELNAGDPQAIQKATKIYKDLQAKAPAKLATDWKTIVAGVGTMVKAANGEIPITGASLPSSPEAQAAMTPASAPAAATTPAGAAASGTAGTASASPKPSGTASVNADRFRDAYARVYQDYEDRCTKYETSDK
ncbi:MAG: hypothetical protein LBM66_01565 [Bifidobacteriaceae bacterium]|jgi:hypothetical protein|nr:hypothetical protein [Bifidobacteriaceae bacterium]